MRRWIFTLIAFLFMIFAGGETPAQIEPLPDEVQAPEETQAFYHLYDTTAYPTFDGIFILYVTDGVEATWGATGVGEFIESVIDSIPGNTADVFPAVWDYFCYGDSDTSYGGVSYYLSSGPYTRIIIRLYDRADFDCQLYSFDECRGYSWTSGTVLTLNATDMPVVEIARDAFAHELQHLCFRANQGTGQFPTLYASTDETLSTCAEYMWKAWEVVAPNTYDQSYDSSVFRCERCDLYEKYYVEQLWVGYLYDALRGDPADPTDDVVYKWLRYRDAGGKMEITMNSLAEVLADPSYLWVGGTTGAERLQNVFRNFLVAKFCDAPGFGSDSRYGYVDLNPVGDLGFFKDLNAWYDSSSTPQTPVDCPAPSPVCPDYPSPVPAGHAGYWNVRILPPSYTLGDWSEGAMDTVSGIYKDGDDTPTDPNDGDHSRDYIDLALWGTDYIIFRAGSYYQDGQEHMLKFWLSGDDSVAANTAVLGSVIGYSSEEEMLQQHPENILFIEPLEVEHGTAHAEISLADFGQSVKAVVVALAYVETDPQTRVLEDAPYFAYTYAYGVVSPEIDALSRVNGTLHAQPDTAAAGCPQGDGDEVVIEVALDPAYGPIATSDFSVTAPDTLALYTTAEADSDASLIDGKYRTTITLSKFGSCGSGPLTVLLNGEVLGTVDVEMRSVDMETHYFPGVVQTSDLARFGVSYQSPPKAYDPCADYRFAGEVNISDLTFFGTHYNHSSGGGSASVAATAMTEATLRLDLVEENPLVGERRLFATVSAENVEPFKALVVSLRSDHARLRFLGWEPDAAYPSTTMGTEVTRDGVRQAFVGVIGDGKPLAPVVEFGRVEFEVLGEEPLVLSQEDLNFIIADLEVVGGGLRSFSPIRLERNEVQPTYRFELAQNVPNPFNPHTTIAYSLASDAEVRLEIFDVRGARVKGLVNGHETTGVHRVRWDGTNDRGARVSSGIYFYRLIAGSFKSTRKMVLLR